MYMHCFSRTWREVRRHTLNQINKFRASKTRSAEDTATVYYCIDMALHLRHRYYSADIGKKNKIESLDKWSKAQRCTYKHQL